MNVMNRLFCLGLISILVSINRVPAYGADPDHGVYSGKKIYAASCGACHGFRGDGRSPAAHALHPKPRNFTEGVFKFRSTSSGTLPTEEDLFRSINEGVPQTSMPAWKDLLTEEEVWDVVAYLKTFSGRFQREVPRPLVVPPEPPMTDETTASGGELYQKAGCFQCHGVSGKGDGPSAKGLKDSWGGSIRPLNFTRGVYKRGLTNQDLYRTLVTGLDGTPMPSYQGTFKPDEVWALVHYIRSLSKKKNLFDRLVRDDPGIPQ